MEIKGKKKECTVGNSARSLMTASFTPEVQQPSRIVSLVTSQENNHSQCLFFDKTNPGSINSSITANQIKHLHNAVRLLL